MCRRPTPAGHLLIFLNCAEQPVQLHHIWTHIVHIVRMDNIVAVSMLGQPFVALICIIRFRGFLRCFLTAPVIVSVDTIIYDIGLIALIIFSYCVPAVAFFNRPVILVYMSTLFFKVLIFFIYFVDYRWQLLAQIYINWYRRDPVQYQLAITTIPRTTPKVVIMSAPYVRPWALVRPSPWH